MNFDILTNEKLPTNTISSFAEIFKNIERFWISDQTPMLLNNYYNKLVGSGYVNTYECGIISSYSHHLLAELTMWDVVARGNLEQTIN